MKKRSWLFVAVACWVLSALPVKADVIWEPSDEPREVVEDGELTVSAGDSVSGGDASLDDTQDAPKDTDDTLKSEDEAGAQDTTGESTLTTGVTEPEEEGNGSVGLVVGIVAAVVAVTGGLLVGLKKMSKKAPKESLEEGAVDASKEEEK